MLNEAKKKGKKDKDSISVGLLMPKINNKAWLKKLFEILSYDGDLNDVSFRIFII